VYIVTPIAKTTMYWSNIAPGMVTLPNGDVQNTDILRSARPNVELR